MRRVAALAGVAAAAFTAQQLAEAPENWESLQLLQFSAAPRPGKGRDYANPELRFRRACVDAEDLTHDEPEDHPGLVDFAASSAGVGSNAATAAAAFEGDNGAPPLGAGGNVGTKTASFDATDTAALCGGSAGTRAGGTEDHAEELFWASFHPNSGVAAASQASAASAGSPTTSGSSQAWPGSMGAAGSSAYRGLPTATAEDFEVRRAFLDWQKVLAGYVARKQEAITYGNAAGPPGEIEADEAVFRKKRVDGEIVQWTEYAGLKRRGDAGSLYLAKRAAAKSRSRRASNGRAVPPPFSRAEWTKLRDGQASWEAGGRKRVGPGTLVHTDGAPAYGGNPAGIEHDTMRHSAWRAPPQYTAVLEHSSGACQAGTQALDGWWGHARVHLRGLNARHEGRVDANIRESQWHHWIAGKDPWLEQGKVVAWQP